MSDVKRCTQCGMLKDAEEFRQYTYSKAKGTAGRFRICRSCESVNSTYKRVCRQLKNMGHTVYGKDIELYHALQNAKEEIENMYDLLDKHGLRTPRRIDPYRVESVPAAPSAIEQTIKQLSTFYAEPNTPPVRNVSVSVEIPEELQAWLNADPNEWAEKELSPEYLQETIYESLKAKYRPQTGVDKETYLPIYDDTYKDTLNQILRKFDDYEEQYVGDADE